MSLSVKAHERAQALMSEGDVLARSGATDRARQLYAEAARAELLALTEVPQDRIRTRGIVALDAVALLKLAHDPVGVVLHGTAFLADPSIPAFFHSRIERLVEAARTASTLALRRVIWSPNWDEFSKTLFDLMSHAGSKMQAVVGELSPAFFERTDVVSLMTRNARKGVQSEFVFSMPSSSSQQPWLAFSRDHPNMSILKKSYPERVHLFWTATRPDYHFYVVDGEHLLVETPHAPGELPQEVIRYSDDSVAVSYEQSFRSWIAGTLQEL